MKALLLAASTLAAVACASEPSAVIVREHAIGTEGDTPAPDAMHPLLSADEGTTTTTVRATTTTTEAEPVTTTAVAPRRTTTSTVYEAVPSPQGRTTGRGSEPPAGDVLERIAGCESGSGPNSPGSYTAQNPRSTASGRYQFLDSTWQGMDAAEGYSRAADAPPAVQDAAARELLAEQGTTPWNASKGCWS